MHKSTLLISLLTTLTSLPLAAETLRLSEPVERTDRYEVFGAPLSDKAEGQSLQHALEDPKALAGEEVRVTTRVAKVCQKKGCFFIATEGKASARVTFADYRFFVPTDSAGKRVTLVGTLSRVQLDPAQAAHYAQDLGEAAEETDAPLPAAEAEYRIVARSVLIPTG